MKKVWFLVAIFLLIGSTSQAVQRPIVAIPIGDYGDAPDGLPCGYSADPTKDVIGRFPTLYNTRNSRVGQPGAYAALVGEEAIGSPMLTSAERGPDDPNDPDHTPNLVNDDLDDGLWVELLPNGDIRFKVRVTLSPTAPAGTRYLNAVYDLNGDGEWKKGPMGDEWIVKNMAIELEPGEETTIEIPIPWEHDWTVALAHPRWLRLVLSRHPIDEEKFSNVGGWDGSGRFEAGEVEDYKIGILNLSDLAQEVRNAFRLAWAISRVRAEQLTAAWKTVSEYRVDIERLHKRALEISQKVAVARDEAYEWSMEAKRIHTQLQTTARKTKSVIARLPCAVVSASASAAVKASVDAAASALAAAEAAAKAAAAASARAVAWAEVIADALAIAQASADALAVARAEAMAEAEALAISWANAQAWTEAMLKAVSIGGVEGGILLPTAWVQAKAWALAWVQTLVSTDVWTSVHEKVQASATAWTRAKAAAEAITEAYAVAEAAAEATTDALASIRAALQTVIKVAATIDPKVLPCWCPKPQEQQPPPKPQEQQPPLEPAVFSLEDLTFSPASPHPGEEVLILAVVANTGGQRDEKDVELYVDGFLIESVSLSLNPGESEGVRFYYTFESSGIYDIEVRTPDDTRSDTISVTELKPAFFVVVSLTIDPEQPVEGDEATITATIENQGEVEGTQEVELLIDSKSVDSQILTLKPGESKTINFYCTFDESGTYLVEVATEDDSDTLTVEVRESMEPPVIVDIEAPEAVVGFIENEDIIYEITVTIYFEDPNADITQLHVEAWHSEMGYIGDVWVDPGIEGEESGSFDDTTEIQVPADDVWCEGYWILAYTLYDSEGNESNTYEIEIPIEGCY